MRLIPLVLVLLLVTSVTAADYNLSFQESEDPTLLNRCFLPASQLQALAGSKILIEGGGIITDSGSGEGSVVNLYTTTAKSVSSGEISSDTGVSSGGFPTDLPEAEKTGMRTSNNPPTTKKTETETGTLLYDQVTDRHGLPLGGETVLVEWTDEKGEKQSATVTTLTKEEATLLGDPEMEGYYFLNRKRLGIPGEAYVSITRGAAPALLSEIQAEEELPREQVLQQPEPELEPVAYLPPESNFERLLTWSREAATVVVSFFTRSWIAIMTIIVLTTGGVMARHPIQEYLNDLRRDQGAEKFVREARALNKKRVKTMIEAPPRLNARMSAREAIGAFLDGKSYALVIEENVIKGIVTPRDLLRIDTKDPDKLKVGDLMSRPVVAIDAETPFHEATKLARKNRILPIIERGKVIGAMTRNRLLQELDAFLSMHLVDARGMPIVKEHLGTAVTATADETIETLIGRLQRTKANLILVTEEREKEGKRLIELVGSITEQQLLEELYNYSGAVEKMDAERIMRRNTKGIAPGATIFEANKVLLDKAERTLAVLQGTEVKGAITEEALLDGLDEYFHSLFADRQS